MLEASICAMCDLDLQAILCTIAQHRQQEIIYRHVAYYNTACVWEDVIFRCRIARLVSESLIYGLFN